METKNQGQVKEKADGALPIRELRNYILGFENIKPCLNICCPISPMPLILSGKLHIAQTYYSESHGVQGWVLSISVFNTLLESCKCFSCKGI